MQDYTPMVMQNRGGSQRNAVHNDDDPYGLTDACALFEDEELALGAAVYTHNHAAALKPVANLGDMIDADLVVRHDAASAAALVTTTPDSTLSADEFDGSDFADSDDMSLLPCRPPIAKAPLSPPTRKAPKAPTVPRVVRQMAQSAGKSLLEFAQHLVGLDDDEMQMLIDQHYGCDADPLSD